MENNYVLTFRIECENGDTYREILTFNTKKEAENFIKTFNKKYCKITHYIIEKATDIML